MTEGAERTYAGRAVADRRADRRSRFHDAALSVFTEKSFAKSSVSDVCARAGLSRRQFYEEYDSREALLTAIYDGIQNDAREAVASAMAEASDSIEETVSAAIAAYVGSVGADTRRTRLAFIEVVGVSESLEQHRQSIRDEWAETVGSYFQAVEPSTRQPPGGWRVASAGLIAAMNGLAHEWAVGGGSPTLDEVSELLTAIALALLDSCRD